MLFKKYRVRRALKDTKKLLLEHGWIQGNFERDGKYCLLGALQKTGRFEAWIPACYILKKNTKPTQELTSWNDKPGRTFDEVIQLLDDSIESV
jgi:hypothetical protein